MPSVGVADQILLCEVDLFLAQDNERFILLKQLYMNIFFEITFHK